MARKQIGAKDYIVQFDDSQLELRGWKKSRYEGSKIISSDFNKSGSSDDGRDLPGYMAAAERVTSNIYFGTTIISSEEEAEAAGLVRFENHSYIRVDTIYTFDPHSGRIPTITKVGVDTQGVGFSPALRRGENRKNLIAVTKQGFSRTVTDDFERASKFNILVLDKKVEKKTKGTYFTKFNMGYFMRVFKYHNKGGAEDGVRLSHAFVSAGGQVHRYYHGGGTFMFGSHGMQITSSTVAGASDPNLIWNTPLPQEFNLTGSKDITHCNLLSSPLTSSANSNTGSLRYLYQNFINQSLISGSFRGFVTFTSGSHAKHTDDFSSLGTVELGGKPLPWRDSADQYYGDPSIPSMHTKGKDWSVRTTLENSGSGGAVGDANRTLSIAYLDGDPSQIGSVSSYGINLSSSYYGPNRNDYQFSVLREDVVLIADLDKESELPDGIGDDGFVLIPDNLHSKIKGNLQWFLMRAGLIPYNKFIGDPYVLRDDDKSKAIHSRKN
tara:strand:- start:481 stop:1965 length:1485 start_codon:yes stop_codon:yes gene_type:complete